MSNIKHCPKCIHPMELQEIYLCHPPIIIYTKWYRCTLCKYETEREENKMVAV